MYFHFNPDITFGVNSSGTEVRVISRENYELAVDYFLSPILGLILWLKGIVALHASAVAVDNKVIAFVGEGGRGKSTIAAALVKMGFGLVTEDLAALHLENDRFYVQPGYPRIKLWPESVKMLFGEGSELPRVSLLREKAYLDLREHGYRFQPTPLPLAAIYVFDSRSPSPSQEAPSIEPVVGRDKFTALMPHTNLYRYKVPAGSRQDHFTLLSRLATTVPVRWLSPYSEPDRLDELCEMILADYREQVAERTVAE